jgi:flavocytochrome c
MLKQVIIIGGGLSGLSAAHTAIESGSNILLLDKLPFCGGNSTKATSGLNAALTKTQIRKGIPDSAEVFEKDTILSAHLGKDTTPYPLAKTLTKESDPCVEWLTSSFDIDLSLVSRLGGHSHPRTHRGKERFPGMTITYALLEKLEEIEKSSNSKLARILTKANATRLLSDDQGNVNGVEYVKDGKTFREYGAVVVATGGFGADFASDSLLNKYRPDLTHLPTTNGAHCSGDGIKMASNVGAELVDMEWIQVHPTGLVHPDDPNNKVKFLAAEALRGVGGILLDANGRRFCDELGRRDYVTGEMNKNKGPFRLVLNSKASKEIEWHCKHYCGRKLMKFFENGKLLAKEMNIQVENLEKTFSDYNSDAKNGTDQYGKKYYHNTPFEVNDSFYVAIVTPVVHYCMGGIKISTEGEVLGKSRQVNGLFAAGEVTGGVHGKNRLGGNSLLECVVFGRIAGKSAVKYILRNNIAKGQSQLVGTKCFNRLTLVKNQLSNAPALLNLTPSNTQSKFSGGTANVLPEERKQASFSIEELTHYINGGKDKTKRRKFIESVLSKDPDDLHQVYNYDREQLLKHHVKEFVRIHKPYKDFKPTREDICYMMEISIGYGSLNNSHGIFIATVVGQGNEEQARFWCPKLYNFEITGSYAQTELGHGSNVRGLQTTAVYNKKTEEFILNTPTLQSIKWWPGCLGKVGTHIVLYAQTLLDGKEYGINVFIVQIRDENHLPLPGVRVGDLGVKMGDNSNDTGFLMLENVRIPRENMLRKYREITKDGRYVDVVKADPKVHYTTMMTTRASMVNTAAARLSQAATIAIRYSAVRQQGFKESGKSNSFKDAEYKIIDYRIQQYRLFKQLAYAYGLRFTGRWMIEQLELLEGKNVGIIKNTEILKELASTSAGLKSITSVIAINGIEDCRKCCGGNGYLLNSGIGSMACDYLWQITAEGDYIILALLTGKHLLKSIGKEMGGAKLQGVLDYLNVLANPDFSLVNIRPHTAKNESDYLNLSYLQSYFQYRAIERILYVSQDVDRLMKNGYKLDQAINECSNEILKATQAHCFLIIYNNFINKVKQCTDQAISKVLTRLCVIFALCNFQDDNWGDLIQGDEYRVIKTVTYKLMSEIRSDAVALVDAFDFPDNVLKSTIGRYDGNVYEALYDAAQKSSLNQNDVFEGYEKYLKPHLNKELLSKGNKPVFNNKF